MPRVWVLVALAAAPVTVRAAPAASSATGVPRLSQEEAAACADELGVVLRRQALFEGGGLSAPEIAERNEEPLRALRECVERFRIEQRRAREQQQDLEEVRRRVGPSATERERADAWKQIRRERLASKKASQLTPEERAELAEGTKEELAATRATLDDAHARDPGFMRTVHSALLCYHSDRKAELEDQISSEESLVAIGTGDRKRVYALRSELRQSVDVLARTREATAGRALERCTAPGIALIEHCMRLSFQGKPAQAMCESEEVQQYVRFVR